MFREKPFPHISKSAEFHPTVKFIGEVFIKSKCNIGESSKIDGSLNRVVIEKECEIGVNTEIYAIESKVIIGELSRIGDNCEILSSIGKRCDIGNNVKIEEGATVGDQCKIGDHLTITSESNLLNGTIKTE